MATLSNNKIKVQQWSFEPTFYYLEFLRYLNLEELFITVRGWKQCLYFMQDQSVSRHTSSSKAKKSSSKNKFVNVVKSVKYLAHGLRKKSSITFGSCKDSFPVSVERVVSYSLAKSIMRGCKSLKHLSVDPTIGESIQQYPCNCMDQVFSASGSSHRVYTPSVPEEHLLIATYPGANKCLSHLTELVCTTRRTKWRLFHALTPICHQLKKISVDMGRYDSWSYGTYLPTYTEPQAQELEWESKNLATLIQSQNSLEIFILSHGEIGLNTILGALKGQAASLRYLEFVNLDAALSRWGSLEQLNELTMLKTLKFTSCEIGDDLMMPLVSNPSSLSQLTRIEMTNSVVSVEMASKLIKNANSSLKSLILGRHSNENQTLTSDLIETTAKYCPNLVNLTSSVSTLEIPQLFTLFTLCPQLESITLMHAGEDSSTVPEEVSWLFEQMGDQQLLRNLRCLTIQAPWSFLPTSLNNYLVNSNPPLRSLEVSHSHCFSDEHLKVILNRIGDKLKKLKLETFNDLDDSYVVETSKIIENFEFLKLKPA